MTADVAAVLARRLPPVCRALCLDCGDPLDGATCPAPGAPGHRLHADCAEARP